MPKETFYFSHDYNSRTDDKIKKLLVKYGMCGYGIYWAIVEDLYNNTNVLQLAYDSIAYDLHCDILMVKSILHDFELFTIENETFKSLSIERRLSERNNKSVKARESVKKRWEKYERNTNVLPPHNDSNTIKESKGKEKIEIIKKDINKDIFDKKVSEFGKSLIPFTTEFGKELIRVFFDYWREPNKSKTKMRWEMEKTFDINLRLKTFQRNDKNFVPDGKQIKLSANEQAFIDQYTNK